ncbi:MAG: peptidylprolyl isomerase [Pirellulales bacterium]|nr:peptidylprolyl isomerase [Pirellulales bacterium]
MQLDQAKQQIETASQGKELKDKSLLHLLAAIEFYRPLWNREQQLRAAEAKADDLPRVKLHTSQGDMVVELFENEAPNTVANFISLVESGFYDGTKFHRVLPGFVAQGGDPRTKDTAAAAQRADDGPGYSIECECTKPEHRVHFRGTLSMAHKGLNTGGSQFFITFVPTGNLDGQHTVFGRVIDGIDVLAKLQRVDPEKPKPGMTPDAIIKAEVLRKRNHAYEPKKLGG